VEIGTRLVLMLSVGLCHQRNRIVRGQRLTSPRRTRLHEFGWGKGWRGGRRRGKSYGRGILAHRPKHGNKKSPRSGCGRELDGCLKKQQRKRHGGDETGKTIVQCQRTAVKKCCSQQRTEKNYCLAEEDDGCEGGAGAGKTPDRRHSGVVIRLQGNDNTMGRSQ